MANRLDPSRLSMTGGNPTPVPESAAAPAASPASGVKAWLPLILTLVAMPFLAYAMTTFILMPKLQQAIGGPANSASSTSNSSKTKDGHGSGHSRPSKEKFSLNKVIVNVAGTMGTRYLMSSITLVGTAADFKTTIEENKDLLLDLTNSTLKSKTINDLEKPGALNQIRTELISVYNNALGNSLVHELYITEFAIQ